ncbi:hypothetical protein TNCV_823501 [Trichonephila clavipes]|nr:hypothetical protein TNCV_823501 [Trichonephila clavipes]
MENPSRTKTGKVRTEGGGGGTLEIVGGAQQFEVSRAPGRLKAALAIKGRPHNFEPLSGEEFDTQAGIFHSQLLHHANGRTFSLNRFNMRQLLYAAFLQCH